MSYASVSLSVMEVIIIESTRRCKRPLGRKAALNVVMACYYRCMKKVETQKGVTTQGLQRLHAPSASFCNPLRRSGRRQHPEAGGMGGRCAAPTGGWKPQCGPRGRPARCPGPSPPRNP